MRPNSFSGWAISLLPITLFALHGCERLEKNSPTGVEETITKQSLGKNSLPAYLSSPPDIIVTTTSDLADFEGGQQVSDLPGPDGLVSLREAIIAANSTAGPNVIGFNIPTSDAGFDGTVYTIELRAENASQQAIEDDGTTVDGTSQSLFSGDTNPAGPEIVLAGSMAGQISGFTVNSNNNAVIGLVLINMPWAGVQIDGDHNRILQCYVGVDETGAAAKGNSVYGISIYGRDNLIRGSLVSGNKYIGIAIEGDANRIEGNLIGTDRTGTQPLGNEDWAICIWRGSGNVIGGTMDQDRNVISGNDVDCVFMTSPVDQTSSDNRIIGNFIGTDITGVHPLPNNTRAGGAGITLGGNSRNNLIERNLIAYNLRRGILIQTDETFSAVGNRFTQNSIHSNEGFGIDLGNDGVTFNDPADVDMGDNNLMNYPVLESVKATPGKLIVKGYIDTPNPRSVTIEFFANPVPNPGGDPSGYGEGAIYLGSARPNPQGKFTATLPPVAPGTLITATATDAEGNTSEFALNRAAAGPGDK